MTDGEERLYTPVVLRTGFMLSYRRTILLLLLLIILEAILWALAGFWPWFNELGLGRWGLIGILVLVVPIGTSTIRDIIAGYANLFGVFDVKTEEKLRLFRSLNHHSPDTQNDMHHLFKDEETYAAFKEVIRRVVLDKTTDIIIIVTIICISVFVLYNTVYEKVVLKTAISSYPLLILELLIDAYATIFLISSLSFLLVFGFGYFYVLNRLGGSPSDLSIWNYIRYLQGAPDKDRSFITYWRFHDYVSTIGRHFSGVAFRIVMLAALGGLAQILYNVSTSTMVTWILAAIPVALSLLILVLPLDSLHRVLLDSKVAVQREFEEAYDEIKLRFLTHLTEQRYSWDIDRTEKADADLADKLRSLRSIIEETRQKSTWPVRTPTVLQIFATSLIPLAYIFIEELLRDLGLL